MMRAFLVVAFSFVAGLLAVAAGAAALTGAAPANVRTAALPFGECLAVMDEAASEAGLAPILLVNTPGERSVRIDAEDGYVTIACRRAEGTIVVTANRQPSATLAASRP
jgi:hypothetical protein